MNSRAQVDQSVATRALNPGVVSSNPVSVVNILYGIWQKSMRQVLFVRTGHRDMTDMLKTALNPNISIYICPAPVAQSVATRAVNSGIVSLNPSSANILSNDWQKSLWQASFL